MKFNDRNLTKDIRCFQPLYASSTEAPFLLMQGSATGAKTAGHTFERNNYPYITFEYVMDGTGIVEIDDQGFIASAGDVYILPEKRRHRIYPKSKTGWTKRFFVTHGTLADALLRLYGLSNIWYFRSGGTVDVVAIFEKMVALYDMKPFDMNHQAALLMHQLIIRLAGVKGEVALALPVLEIKYYLDRHLYDKFSLSRLSAFLGLSERHISRIFKEAMAVTPFEYYTSERLKLVLELLRTTDRRIGEIAEIFQFTDQYHLAKVIKAHTGLSPTAYRGRFSPGVGSSSSTARQKDF